MSRLTVVTNGNYFAARILADLFDTRPASIAGIVVVDGDYTGRTGMRAWRSVARSACFPYVMGKSVHLVSARLAAGGRRSASVSGLAGGHSIPTVHVDHVSDPRFLEHVRAWKTDLLVSVSCPQRLPEASFTEPRLGGVNIHSSLLPSYAGLAPYYWILAGGEEETGISVHYLTSEFDEGRILGQRRLMVRRGESALGLFARLAYAGSGLLREAIAAAEASDPGTEQDLSVRSYHSQPDWASYRALRRNGHRVVSARDLADVWANG